MREYRLLFEHKPTFGQITVYVITEEIHRTTWITIKRSETNSARRAGMMAVAEALRPWPGSRPSDLKLVRCDEISR